MKAYIAFGSNYGDRLENIIKALDLLSNYGKITKVSTIYESLPWGVTNQPNFLNGVLELETQLDPLDLLRVLKDIEKAVGRTERYKWGPREIDLDILLYENYIIMLSFLRIPHPHMEERDFVVIPLLEIAGHLVHPLTKKTIEFRGQKVNLQPFVCLLK